MREYVFKAYYWHYGGLFAPLISQHHHQHVGSKSGGTTNEKQFYFSRTFRLLKEMEKRKKATEIFRKFE